MGLALTTDHGRRTTDSAQILGPALSHLPIPDIHEVAFDGGSGGHHGADQVSAAALALVSFEVSVRSAGAALAAGEHVGIHPDAHAATGIAPLESCRAENLIQTFLFRLSFHASGAGNDQRAFQCLRNLPARRNT